MKPHRKDEKYGCLEHAKRVWAVASIHGQSKQLRALHNDLLGKLQVGDRIVYLGNYMGRGDDTVGVMDELLVFRRNLLCLPGMAAQDIIFLRGAQEEMWRKLLQIQLAPEPDKVFDWMMEHGVGETLSAYGQSERAARAFFREGTLATTKWTTRLRESIEAHPGHTDLLFSLRRAAYTANGELLLVHAGIDPSRPVSEQTDTFWWGSGYFDKIDSSYFGFKKVIRGYDRDHSGIVETDYTLSIDSGCGLGGELNAVCIDLTGKILDRIKTT
jgi:serine/threonine protein phosphatase 1